MRNPEISDIELSFSEMKKGISCNNHKIMVLQDKVPAGTKTLSLLLEDTDLLNFPHGMHIVKFTGENINLEDKFEIIPLSPPPGESHKYQLTVRAFDEHHIVIGDGTAIKQ